MAGMATVIVYALERGQEIVADAITFPVSPRPDKKFSIDVQTRSQDRHLRISVTGIPGSRVSLTGINSEVFGMNYENDFTQQQVRKL